jgi:transposase-like protein
MRRLPSAFKESLGFFFHVTKPRVITVDGNKAYPVAIRELKMKKAYHMVCHFGLKNI